MAMHVGCLSHDQNFCVHYDGAPTGVKTNGSMVQKKGGGLGGRKALNDISNSGKPSAFQASRKHNTRNVIPIGEDLGISKKTQVPFGGKSQVKGRKALSDVTNLVKPFGQQQSLKKKSRENPEDENLAFSVAEEGFLHNHQECVKSERKAMDLDQFLKTIGLDEDVSVQSVAACCRLPRKSKAESLMKLFEIEDLPEPIIQDRSHQSQKSELLPSGQSSPMCGSPKSPRPLPYVNMKDYDDFPGFILAATP